VNRASAALCALLLGVACGPGNEAARAPTSPRQERPRALVNARLLPRYDATDPSVARLAWSGSGAAARFRGTRIDARLHDPSGHNAFQVMIDGAPTNAIAMQPTGDTYTLASGLAEGEHEVVFEKRTEARVGEVEFLGFVVPDGDLLPPPPPQARRIELVGDSITAGYGNEGPNQHCRFSPTTENAFMTYGAIAARALNAEHAIVAWSGHTIDGMSEVYDRALPQRTDSVWDARSWTPDVVVVNLGTNDVTRGDQQPEFVASYVKLLEHLRERYPQALFVSAVGPMLTDTYPPGKHTLTRARKYIQAALATRKQAGDARIVYMEFATQDGSTGYGCDYHPSKTTHERMAEKLVGVLKTEMGW
jgi:lysophospholipase L1-like esterase